jgi:hypothetical protein
MKHSIELDSTGMVCLKRRYRDHVPEDRTLRSIEIDQEMYSYLGTLRYSDGGPLRWRWNDGAPSEVPDPRIVVRVVCDLISDAGRVRTLLLKVGDPETAVRLVAVDGRIDGWSGYVEHGGRKVVVNLSGGVATLLVPTHTPREFLIASGEGIRVEKPVRVSVVPSVELRENEI